jgi:uncharacterized DUF497 family protein
MRRAVGFEWDERKARANLRKHRVDFADAATVFEDDRALTAANDDPEKRALCHDRHGRARQGAGRGLHERGERIRIISARLATRRARGARARFMKREYDFSKGKRGAIVPPEPGKTRITIRLDNEILDHFRKRVHQMGGGNYQTLINDALHEYVRGASLEKVVRQAVREEVGAMKEALVKTA